MHNNLFYCLNDDGALLYYEDRTQWTSGSPVIYGTNNWVQEGFDCTDLTGWTGILTSTDPGFVDEENFDFRLRDDSPSHWKGYEQARKS